MQQILEEILASTSEDESSEDSLLNMEMSSSLDSSEEEHISHPKVSDFEAVIREMNDVDFKKNFRLNRSTAQILLERYKASSFYHGRGNGTHVKIKAPRSNKESYLNQKWFYSVCLQAVVDADKKFIDVFCGEPGSLHDGRVLRRSPLYQRAVANVEEVFPHNTFLLGDSAYPCLEWLVSPFKDNRHLSTSQCRFNVLHTSARVVVENAFGLWKSRFRRVLHFTEQRNLNFVVNLIVATCILHNLCIDQNDGMEQLQQASDEEDINAHQSTSTHETNRRQQLLEELIRKGVINNQ